MFKSVQECSWVQLNTRGAAYIGVRARHNVLIKPFYRIKWSCGGWSSTSRHTNELLNTRHPVPQLRAARPTSAVTSSPLASPKVGSCKAPGGAGLKDTQDCSGPRKPPGLGLGVRATGASWTLGSDRSNPKATYQAPAASLARVRGLALLAYILVPVLAPPLALSPIT